MKAGRISLDDLGNGVQRKDTPVEVAPNTRTAAEVRAVYRDAAARRAELYRPIDERPAD